MICVAAAKLLHAVVLLTSSPSSSFSPASSSTCRPLVAAKSIKNWNIGGLMVSSRLPTVTLRTLPMSSGRTHSW